MEAPTTFHATRLGRARLGLRVAHHAMGSAVSPTAKSGTPTGKMKWPGRSPSRYLRIVPIAVIRIAWTPISQLRGSEAGLDGVKRLGADPNELLLLDQPVGGAQEDVSVSDVIQLSVRDEV